MLFDLVYVFLSLGLTALLTSLAIFKGPEDPNNYWVYGSAAFTNLGIAIVYARQAFRHVNTRH